MIAAVYLIATKTASWKITTSVLAGSLGMEVILYLFGLSRFPDPIYAILSGGVLFGAVFMATDPITAPSTDAGKWIFGFLVGILLPLSANFPCSGRNDVCHTHHEFLRTLAGYSS